MKIHYLRLGLFFIFFSCNTVEETPAPDWEFLFKNFIDQQSLTYPTGIYILKNETLCKAIDCQKTYKTTQGHKVFIYPREEFFMRKMDRWITIKDLEQLKR